MTQEVKPPWWRPLAVRPDIEPIVAKITADRFRLFMPVIVFGIIIALAISAPAGVAVSGPIVAINLIVCSVAIAMWLAFRSERLAIKYAHPFGAFVWLLCPINTLSSYALTHQPTLVLPLMIELATAALQISTRWTLISTLPVLLFAIPLAAQAEALPIYPAALAGMWVVAIVMQMGLRRSIIRAETHRIDVETAAARLAKELEEKQLAEQDRERLRDQFVHAQRMDAVGTLAAGLAHDMNNILGGILAFAEVLYGEAKDKETKSDLAKIRQEAERGAALTRSLLAFSRRGQYRKRPILLHSVLDDMMPLIARSLGKNIEIVRADGPSTIIEGDPAQLGQVLLNLCLNAKDAMNEKGQVTIATDEVELADGEVEGLPAGRYAKLAITDTGSGMDAETKKRAFEPFFTTKPVGKGTGLGLAMVFGAVQSHGGAIVVDSTPGKGTMMTIYLPASEASPALPVSDPAPRKRTKGLVLVVDDEPVVRAATARLVERLGMAVVTATDGDEAVAIYKQRKAEISLVLLDMVMPKLPGPQCYRELRKLGRTPVLLVSGFANDLAAQDLLETGADGFLEKPFTADQLAAELDRLLGRAA